MLQLLTHSEQSVVSFIRHVRQSNCIFIVGITRHMCNAAVLPRKYFFRNWFVTAPSAQCQHHIAKLGRAIIFRICLCPHRYQTKPRWPSWPSSAPCERFSCQSRSFSSRFLFLQGLHSNSQLQIQLRHTVPLLPMMCISNYRDTNDFPTH